ncbi:flavin reductase like domain-containing protein [Aspergillus granulosus]|uniref:Flavin reductase like domain-containing protein n=1 Tax=Aspergillus granulosus TaxID=176169 RepID=A0ABR4GZ76_9EURO
MRLFHSRALQAASRTARQYRGARYTHPIPISHPYTTSSQRSSNRTTTAPLSSPRTEAQNEPSTSLPLLDQVRLLMRRVPYPVAIITSTDPTPSSAHTATLTANSEPPSTKYRGMTVSSFNTVTLTPQPVISFNVRRPSETLHALLTSGRFLVHLLSPTQETAALARDFARGNQNLALEKSKFEFVACTPSQSSLILGAESGGEGEGTGVAPPLPMLRQKKSASTPGSSDVVLKSETDPFPFIFECKLLSDSVVEVYDHTIVVGSVMRAIARSAPTADATAASSKDLCLTYADTRFWEVGREI